MTSGSPSVTGVCTELLDCAMVWRFDGWPQCSKLGCLMFSKADLGLSLHISMHNNLSCFCCLKTVTWKAFIPSTLCPEVQHSDATASACSLLLGRKWSWRASPWERVSFWAVLVEFSSTVPICPSVYAIFIVLCKL